MIGFLLLVKISFCCFIPHQSNSQDVKTNGIKISEMVFREEVIRGTGEDLVRWTNNFVSTTWLYVGVRGANTFKLRVPPKGESYGSVVLFLGFFFVRFSRYCLRFLDLTRLHGQLYSIELCFRMYVGSTRFYMMVVYYAQHRLPTTRDLRIFSSSATMAIVKTEKMHIFKSFSNLLHWGGGGGVNQKQCGP